MSLTSAPAASTGGDDAEFPEIVIENVADHEPTEPGRRTGRGRRRVRRFVKRRWRRIVAVFVIVMTPITWSYVGYLTAPGAASWDERSVEWVRDHGGEGVVNHIEQWWYTRSAPGDGIPPVSALPDTPAPVPARGATVSGTVASAAPASLVPVASDAMPGEGVWTPGVQSVDGAPVLYTTFIRPDVDNSRVLAGVVWFDQNLVRTVAVPGTKQPGGSGWAWDSGIPSAERDTLVAAFNSGFKFRHIDGGYFTEGRTPEPLLDGHASLVIDADGRIDVGVWGRDFAAGPDIVSVRQNLHLIVDNSVPVAGLRDNADGLWGKRRHQLQLTWRSGIGVTADGNIVVVGGDRMTLTALAESLSRAGAVRGMQLDIHNKQVTVNLFQPRAGTTTGVDATKLLPGMHKSETRYLAADQRDFFAVFVR